MRPDDDGLEALLRRFRPLGPPDGMRERVLALCEAHRPVSGVWLVAAAALLLAAGVSLATHASLVRVERALEAPADRLVPLDDTARWLGLSETERAHLARQLRTLRAAAWRRGGALREAPGGGES